MYSEEILHMLQESNYRISRDQYNEITPIASPQINRVSYDTYTNKFKVFTNDGYEFEFEVYAN